MCQIRWCQRSDLVFPPMCQWLSGTLLPLSILSSYCSHCFDSLLSLWLLSCFFLSVVTFASPHFLTFLFNALCILYWKCHYHTTGCPSLTLSPQTVFPLHIPFACTLLPDDVCPYLLVSHSQSPCLPFLCSHVAEKYLLAYHFLVYPKQIHFPCLPFSCPLFWDKREPKNLI